MLRVWYPACALLRGGRSDRWGGGLARKVRSLGLALGRDTGPRPVLFLSLLPGCYEVSTFALPQAATMMFCLAQVQKQ